MGTVQTTASPAWLSVAEQTTCEAMHDDNCLGRYGFTIYRNGSFLTGPSPEGKKIEGRITPEEMRHLEALMRAISPEASAKLLTCESRGLPGNKEQIDVTFAPETVVRIYDLGGKPGQLCYRGDSHQVEQIHKYMHSLMERYYPIPFPSRR
jgi:hypothetical protein